MLAESKIAGSEVASVSLLSRKGKTIVREKIASARSWEIGLVPEGLELPRQPKLVCSCYPSGFGGEGCGNMTERLYYSDSFLREFDARLSSCVQDGERWRVALDQTAFYPTSGGQPHDLGKLGGVPVIEVADADPDRVVHYTSAEVASGPIHGEIDWPRRIDHMQQHTGQHLLSAAFSELFKFPTVSFHLGREASTIDLDAPSIVPRHLQEAE